MRGCYEEIEFVSMAITICGVAIYLSLKLFQRYPWPCFAGVGFLLTI